MLQKLSLLCIILLLFANCQNQADPLLAEPVTLSRDGLSLTVEPAIGGRISSLKLDGVEVLKTSRDSNNLQWGSTVWSSPQADWKWPPIAAFDTAPFRLTVLRENTLLLEGPRDPETLLRLRKRIFLGKNQEVGLTYWLTNEGASAVSVALWENTRLPYAGYFEFAADSLRVSGDTLPTTAHDSIFRIYVDAAHVKPQKVFTDLPAKTASYHHNGVVFRKYTNANAFYRVAPGQAPLEIYLDPPAGFVEFELQGDYRRLEPGESNNLRVKWKLEKE